MARKQQAPVRRSRRQATPRVEVPQTLMQFTVVGPSMLYDDILAAAQKAYQATGVKVHFQFNEVTAAEVAPTAGVAVPNGGGSPMEALSRAAAAVGVAAPARGQTRAATATRAAHVAAGVQRNQVVYQAVTMTPATGSSRQVVKAYIIRHRQVSARQVMEGTGLRQKQVESAIHGLRTDGEIQAIAVQ